ncbi:MAG: hypothetical protein ACOCZT_03590, partial [Halanaerobiales bacterium]
GSNSSLYNKSFNACALVYQRRHDYSTLLLTSKFQRTSNIFIVLLSLPFQNGLQRYKLFFQICKSYLIFLVFFFAFVLIKRTSLLEGANID